jgi:integrase
MSSRRPKLGSIYQRGGVWWIKFYRNGQPVRESSKSDSYAEAERLLKRRQGEVVTGKFVGLQPERIRVAQLAEEVVEEYQRNKRASTDDVRSRLKCHLLPALGAIRAAELGTRHIKRYIAQRQESGAANATINRELAIIKRAFNLAAKSDPPLVARVPYVPSLDENNVRIGFLEHDAYLRLRNELPEAIGYHVGSRLGELRGLRWAQIDLRQNRIVLNPGTTKNKEGRSLPIYGEMPYWLNMQRDLQAAQCPDCEFVFHRDGEKIGEFYKSWRSACKRAGVAGLLFHDLRRTAVRNMIRAGISEKIAMQISGHKSRSVFDRYDIVNDRDIAEAAAKMERYLDATGTVSGTIQPEQPNTEQRSKSKLLN